MASSVATLALATSPLAAADGTGYPPGDGDTPDNGLIGGWQEQVETPEETDVTEPPAEGFTGWQQVDGAWYYLSASGAMQSDQWIGSGSAWYYLTGSGAMATGWQNVGGTWYHFDSSGAMQAGQWLNSDNLWYYLTGSGATATGWVKIGYGWQSFTSSGAWIDGYQSCPAYAPIKGNKDSMIYHLPRHMAYKRTVAEECFSSQTDARHAGYRAARR